MNARRFFRISFVNTALTNQPNRRTAKSKIVTPASKPKGGAKVGQDWAENEPTPRQN
jgi:hypothetical protein